MTRQESTTRRRFLKSASAAALTAPIIVPRSALGTDDAPPPSERVTMGFIGCGRQCYHKNIPLFVRALGVQALAVCDVDAWRLDNAVKQIKTQYDSDKARRLELPTHYGACIRFSRTIAPVGCGIFITAMV